MLTSSRTFYDYQKITIYDQSTQAKNRINTTEEIKDYIATVSYHAGVSVPKARVAVEATCENCTTT